MTVFRLALSELKRLTRGTLPKLALVALSLVPLLYGAVYLYANWDPYNKLSDLRAAIVVDDRGAEVNGKTTKVGDQVAQTLIHGNNFKWTQVSSDQEADDGVAHGDYSFALKIPADFSANLASPQDFNSAQQAILQVTMNDGNNYLLSKIVDVVTQKVHDSVANQVGQQTADQLLTGFGAIHTQVVKASDGAHQMADGSSQLKDGINQLHSGTSELRSKVGPLQDGVNQLDAGSHQLLSAEGQLATGADQLAGGAGQLNDGLGQLAQKASALPDATKQLSDGAAQVAAGNAELNTKVQSIVGELDSADQQAKGQLEQVMTTLDLTDDQKAQVRQAISQDLQPVKDRISTDASDIQRLSNGSQQVANGASQLAGSAGQLTDAIGTASDGANQLSTGANKLSAGEHQAVDGTQKLADSTSALASGAGALVNGVNSLDDGAAELQDGAATLDDGTHQLANSLDAGAKNIPNPDQSAKDRASAVMGNPVAVNQSNQASAGNYGEGLAPFFLILALWIGGFMLVQAMRPLTQRALASNAPSWKVAVGGWIPFFLVSVAQALVLYAVVYFGLHLNPEHPWGVLGLLVLTSMTFTALIQGIVALLGTVGKFVVLLLLVLQLVSSGGTFPWQTTPPALHPLHAILPMGHVVEGIRSLIYGSQVTAIGPVVLALLGYAVLGILISILAVRKHKRWTLKTVQPEIAI